MVKVCDMHDLNEWWVVVEATRRFEIDNRQYEVDLCAEHNAALDEALSAYIAVARSSFGRSRTMQDTSR